MSSLFWWLTELEAGGLFCRLNRAAHWVRLMGRGASSQPIRSCTLCSQSIWGTRLRLLMQNCAFQLQMVRNYSQHFLVPVPFWSGFWTAVFSLPCRHHHPSSTDFCRGHFSGWKPCGTSQHSQPFQLHPHPNYASQRCACGSALENLCGLQKQVILCKSQFISRQHLEEGRNCRFFHYARTFLGPEKPFSGSTHPGRVSQDLLFP